MADEFDQYFEPQEETEDFEQFFEAPAASADQVPTLESAARGLAQSTPVGTWADEAYAQGGKMAYGAARAIRGMLPGGVPEGAPTPDEVYEKLRKQYQDRDAQAADEDPAAYYSGLGAGVLAQGGAQAIKSLPGMIRSAPAAAGALMTREGLKAAGAGAAKAAAAGAGYGALAGAGAADPGRRLEGAGTGGALGAVVGAPLGAYGGAAAQGLADDAARTGRAAGAARTLEAADEAVASVKEKNRLAQEAYDARAATYADDAAAHADEVERLKQQHAADKAQGGAERGAIDDQLKARHAAEVERLKQQHAADVAEAENARTALQGAADEQTAAARLQAEMDAKAPTKDKAVRLFGLEGIKDPEKARKSAEALFDTQGPGGGKFVDEILGVEPAKGLELVRGLKKQAGAELGAVRDRLVQSGARVNVGPLLGELRESIGALPSGAREVAANAVDDIVIKGSAGTGEMGAAQLRQTIENLDIPSKFGATLANGSPARETAPVFRRARAMLLEAEKGMVDAVAPDMAAGYTDSLRRYGLFSDAEIGAKAKLGRENKGLPAVRYPEPAKVAEVPGPYKAAVAPPVLPDEPAGPYKAAVAPPVLPPAPERPRKPLNIPSPARPANEAELKALVDQASPLRTRLLKRGAGMAVRAAGGGPLAAMGAEEAAGRWLKSIVPSADQLGERAASAAARLQKWAPIFERAQREGPKSVIVTHHLLMQNIPEYREVFEAPAEEVQVRAEKSPRVDMGMPVKAPIVREPHPNRPAGVGRAGPWEGYQDADIIGTAEQDAAVLKHFRDNPQDPFARNETGWQMQQDLAGPEEGINALGAPIKGGPAHVDFRWTPDVHRVNAVVHTHPKVRGYPELNRQNSTGSKGDAHSMEVAGVPNYFLSTDGKVHVLERVGGKIVERILEESSSSQ